MNKHEQLGMNASTAQGRLVKDLLFKFVSEKGIMCFRCGEKMEREDFSIDHKIPWLHSENPIGLFFDLDNISFSHWKCNTDSSRQTPKTAICGSKTMYWRGCRCTECKKAHAVAIQRWRANKRGRSLMESITPAK